MDSNVYILPAIALAIITPLVFDPLSDAIKQQIKNIRASSSPLKKTFYNFLSLERKLLSISLICIAVTSIVLFNDIKILDKLTLTIFSFFSLFFYKYDKKFFRDHKSSLENFERFYNEKYLNFIYRFTYRKKRIISVFNRKLW